MGVIELKQDCTFVAVPISVAYKLINKLNNTRLKKKKVRIQSDIKKFKDRRNKQKYGCVNSLHQKS